VVYFPLFNVTLGEINDWGNKVEGKENSLEAIVSTEQRREPVLRQ
jgi:hypothetical protein